MIIYQKGSLFDAPKGSLLVHACNARGSWGAGIAAAFRTMFPESYREYKQYCQLPTESTVGTCYITQEHVVCLMTAKDYGAYLDWESAILTNTDKSLEELFTILKLNPNLTEIHSCKFNSGLFRVDWEKTEALIQKYLDQYDIKWYVWEP